MKKVLLSFTFILFNFFIAFSQTTVSVDEFTPKKNNVKDCDDKCQTDFTNSLNSIGIENSQEKYSYYSPYRPEMEEANYEFRGVLANVGLVLMGSGVPVGGILVVPKALDYLGGSIYSFQDGDIEGGIKI